MSSLPRAWITSDTHVSHPNISSPKVSTWAKGFRNFDSIEHMNDTIVRNINSCVGKDDLLIHLGDVAFGDKKKTVREFVSRLNCKKFLVLNGNHDNKEVNREVFGQTYDYYEYKHSKVSIVLCHYPILSWNGMSRGNLHCHGHIHSNPRREHGRSMDVGMDGNNMMPYLLDDVVTYLRGRDVVGEGHHV